MMQCYMCMKFFSTTKFCARRNMKEKISMQLGHAYFLHACTIRIKHLIILSFFHLAQNFIKPQISYEHGSLHHISFHIFMDFFIHFLMFSNGAI
jgi:hypothetical protein